MRRTVNSHVGDRRRRLDGGWHDGNRRPRQFSRVEMQLHHEGATHRDSDGVLARIAPVRLKGRTVMLFRQAAVVRTCRCVRMPVDCRPMVVVRVVMADILVHM
jgi:hypothetical protein